tara:strand:+ start:1790 stop:2467 length:678 start_codon:yes stop_codon:yes gene_type:complete
MTILMMLWVFMASALAEEPDLAITVEEKRRDYQVIQIYVDITEVHAPDGTKGTSIPLNLMISNEAQKTSMLNHRLQYLAAHNVWRGEINVYDWRNVQYLPTYTRCDYSDAVRCGIKNSHWTLRTLVSVGEKFSLLQVTLYDEKGKVIGSSSRTAWGRIRWKPQWKLTKIKQNTMYGPTTTEVFEQWPPKMEEIPPLITPFMVYQSVFGFYGGADKTACRLKYCRK